MHDSGIESQAVFNQVMHHLAKQKRRASNPGGALMCSYKTWDGLSCAVGCLFADDEYQIQFEGKPVSGLALHGLLPKRLVPYKELLQAMQNVHDSMQDLVSLRKGFVDIALAFELSPARVYDITEWEF